MRFLVVGKAVATGVPTLVRGFLTLNGSTKATIYSKYSLLSGRIAIVILTACAALILSACQPSLMPASLQAITQSASSQSSSSSSQSSGSQTSGSQSSGTSQTGATQTSAWQPALPQVQAYQADNFVDSIGVGIHMTYTDTNYYSQWPTVFNDLQWLGVRHVRDGYYNFPAGTPYVAEHQQLASAGIKTDYVMPVNSSTTSATVASIAQKVGDMEAVEAPNECDLPGDCGTTAAQSMSNMLAFLPTVDASGVAAGVPVFGPSLADYTSYSQVGNLSAQMTQNNLHVYFVGRNPGNSGWGGYDAQGNSYGSIPFWLDMANQDAPSVPVNITETGYVMVPQPQPYNISLATGASYIPRSLLLTFMHGVKRTYVYELLDEVSSPGYGLIDSNMNPKPAFLAMQSLIANLWDKGPSFTPGKLSMSLTGGDSTLRQILFQKRDGSFWLVLWLEQSSWDPVNLVTTPVTAQKVTLKLNTNYAVTNIGTIQTSGNMHWISTAGSTQTISVSDAVTLVKILPE